MQPDNNSLWVLHGILALGIIGMSSRGRGRLEIPPKNHIFCVMQNAVQNKSPNSRIVTRFSCGFESHRRQYFCIIRMSTSTKKPVFMRIFASCASDGSGLEPVFLGSMQHEIQHDAANRSGACGDALRLQQSRCIGILFRSDCDYDCAGVII